MTWSGSTAPTAWPRPPDRPTARLSGGDGRDELEFRVPKSTGELVVDNAAETFRLDKGVLRRASMGPGNDWLELGELGTGAPDRGSIEIPAGDVDFGVPGFENAVAAAGSRLVMVGGEGRNRLEGSQWPDVLIGGAGFDKGNGHDGRDRCLSIERRTSCERVR